MSNTSSSQSVTPVGGTQSGSPSSQGGGLHYLRKCHRVAILIDGEWFRKELESCFLPTSTRKAIAAAKRNGTNPPTNPIPNGITAEILYRNSLKVLHPREEECFRIFYYDALPFLGKVANPIDQSETDYAASAVATARKRFFLELSEMELVAVRNGDCRARGWKIKDSILRQRIQSGQNTITLNATDISHTFEQKGVDMRIGMDVATLSLKRIVDRIIILSGDTDLIPAMKLARREGLQVGIGYVAKAKPHATLVEDSDFVRRVQPTLK